MLPSASSPSPEHVVFLLAGVRSHVVEREGGRGGEWIVSEADQSLWHIYSEPLLIRSLNKVILEY